MVKGRLGVVVVLATWVLAPCFAWAQGALGGDWELSHIASNSRFGAAYSPIKDGGSIAFSEEAVVFTKGSDSRRYVLTPLGGQDIIGQITHDTRTYTYVARFRRMSNGGGTVSIHETLVPQPGDAAKLSPLTTVVTITPAGDEMVIMVTGPTIERPQTPTTLSYTSYRKR